MRAAEARKQGRGHLMSALHPIATTRRNGDDGVFKFSVRSLALAPLLDGKRHAVGADAKINHVRDAAGDRVIVEMTPMT